MISVVEVSHRDTAMLDLHSKVSVDVKNDLRSSSFGSKSLFSPVHVSKAFEQKKESMKFSYDFHRYNNSNLEKKLKKSDNNTNYKRKQNWKDNSNPKNSLLKAVVVGVVSLNTVVASKWKKH